MERALVELAQRGDEQAYASLARMAGDRLMAVAYRILRNTDRAEDAVQQTIVTAWRESPSLGDPGRFAGWLYRMLVHVCYAEARAPFPGPAKIVVVVNDDGTNPLPPYAYWVMTRIWRSNLVSDSSNRRDAAAEGRLAARQLLVLAGVIAVLLAGAVTWLATNAERPVRMTTLPANIVDIGVVPEGAVGRSLPSDADLASGGSEAFMIFRVRGVRNDPDRSEWCLSGAGPRMVTLAHIMSCHDEVRIFRPSQVDCHGLGPAADTQAMSRVILTSPELRAVDLGPIRPGDNVPLDLFAMPMEGQVIDLQGGLAIGNGVDAATCRFLVEQPGERARAAGDPPPPPASIEIEGGLRMRLILVDAPGGLTVIRVATQDPTDGEGGAIDHMLGNVYAIRFS